MCSRDKPEGQEMVNVKRLFSSNNLFFAVPFLAIVAVVFLIGYLLLGVGITASVIVVAGAFVQQTNWLFAIPAILVLNGIYQDGVTRKWTNYLLVYSLAVRNSKGRWVDSYDGSVNESLLDEYSSAIVQSFSPSKSDTEFTVWNKEKTKWTGRSTVISSPEYLSEPREWKKIYKYEGRNDDSPSNFINGVFFRDAGPYQEPALEARYVSACKANRSYAWAKYSAAIVVVISIISFLVSGF
jgi:hypothetical protein